jgi:hypothetical protein
MPSININTKANCNFGYTGGTTSTPPPEHITADDTVITADNTIITVDDE